MRNLLKLLGAAGLIVYLLLGEGPAPSTAREAGYYLDKRVTRYVMGWSVRLYNQPMTAEWSEEAIVWLWQSRDAQEKEVMRRYLHLRGLTLR